MPIRKATSPFAALGVVLSAYAIYVEHKISHKPLGEEFSALCDIESIGASCSTAFALPEGKMVSYFGFVEEGHWLDVPNPVLGLIYYCYWLFLRSTFPKEMTAAISTLAMMSSVFLAYKLIALDELCILCWSTHLINTRLVWSALSSSIRVQSPEQQGAKVKRV